MWGDKARYAPEEPGVYAFYNEDRDPIYIGGSRNLRQTFTRHLETNFSDDPRKRETRYYRRELTSDWEERAREILGECRRERGELPKLNIPSELPEEKVSREFGFHFYRDVDEPLGESALSLTDLLGKIVTISADSLEFHQERGDFARWIRDVFKETQLADRVDTVKKTGEQLRQELLNILRNPHLAECPKCGTSTKPVKTWKMAGRPSKTGEKLQLTIALYKCSNCQKTYRKALKKELISP